MKILFYGWYENNNIGDESYRLSLPMLFPCCAPTFVNELSPEIVAANDLIVLGGGNVLNRQFVHSLAPYRGIKPIYAVSVGCCDWSLTADDFSIFTKIIIRDRNSEHFLNGLGVKNQLLPDAAFMLLPCADEGRDLIKRQFANENSILMNKIVAVVVNAYIPRDGQKQLARDDFRFQMFSYDLADVCDRLKASCVFIPFGCKQPWDDRVSNGWVAMKCTLPQKNVVVYEKHTPQQVLNMLAAVDVVVSTRLHSTIFSLLSGTPFLDIYHNDKNKFFKKSIAVGEYVDYWDFSREGTLDKINGLLNISSEGKDAYIAEGRRMKDLVVNHPMIIG